MKSCINCPESEWWRGLPAHFRRLIVRAATTSISEHLYMLPYLRCALGVAVVVVEGMMLTFQRAMIVTAAGTANRCWRLP